MSVLEADCTTGETTRRDFTSEELANAEINARQHETERRLTEERNLQRVVVVEALASAAGLDTAEVLDVLGISEPLVVTPEEE